MDLSKTHNTVRNKELKYPESVVKMSESLQQAYDSKSPVQETVQCESHFEDQTYSFQAPVEGDNSDTTPVATSSSESSTPTGSPSSSITCGHSCGSLFGNCAKQRRWPLLQTFCNRNSPLSQQTFSNKSNHTNNNGSKNNGTIINNCHINNSQMNRNLKINATTDKSYNNLIYLEKEPNKKILRTSKENSTEGNKWGKNTSKNKVKFANSSPESMEIKRTGFDKTRVKSSQYPTRRHHSVPMQTEKFLWRKDEINSNQYIPTNNYENLKNESRKSSEESQHQYWLDKNYDYRKVSLHMKYFKNEDTYYDDDEHIYENIIVCKDGASARIFHKDFETKNYNEFGSFFKMYENRDGRTNRPNVNNDAEQWKHEKEFLETTILLFQREMKKLIEENLRLKRDVQKLSSVLQDTCYYKCYDDLQDSHGMPRQAEHIPNSNKKQGISAESFDYGSNHDQIEIQHFKKDFRSKQLIKEALMENDFLKNLDTCQVREIVEAVYPMVFSKGDYVLREGEPGSHLYVSAEGQLEIIKGQNIIGKMGPGKAFGELAVLYNCRRTASIRVVSDTKVWALDRTAFQKIMMKTGLQRFQENLNLLRSVPLLQSLSDEVLGKIADVLEVDFYPSGEHIIRQGATGDTFFIISSGSVKVTQHTPGTQTENEIRILNKGDYFGEQALLKEECRTANVIALSPGVECLTLDRESFIQLIGDLSELQEKNYGNQIRGLSGPSNSSGFFEQQQEFEYIRLEDLDVIATIGEGAFARVKLVQYSKDKNLTFALKCLKKIQIVQGIQQGHAFSEKNIMMACNSPFICRLYKTFKDSRYIYMLQELLLGGEVHTLLKKEGCFNEYATKFFMGCVIEAFEYLHIRGIIYRDLKPENLLMDEMGYAKLADFGFSKRLGFSSKAWTFCGTPEYLAPEIILKKGHDRAVDYWTLGILMAELLMGKPPFEDSNNQLFIYCAIIKGIDLYKFPRHITKSAENLIKKLCRFSPSERLGYQRGGIQDIKKHKWFQGFDWEGLQQRALKPPFQPIVRGPADTSNFETYSPQSQLPDEEFSGWDANF